MERSRLEIQLSVGSEGRQLSAGATAFGDGDGNGNGNGNEHGNGNSVRAMCGASIG